MHALSQNAVWLAIYLPRLSIDRLIRSGRAPHDKPLAVYAKEANAFLLTGVDARASALGLKLAMSLADARAIHPDLAVMEAEPEEDARTLDNIAAWCERFTPVVVLDPPDGLFLDITGCGHLFGGEDALRGQIVARLYAQGFASRAALAPTPGAAWALARYAQNPTLSLAERVAAKRPGEGRSNEPTSELLHAPHPVRRFDRNAIDRPSADHASSPSPQGRKGVLLSALSPLPVEALRLDEDAAALLRRLGLKTIGHLLDAPRASFTARAGERAMRRLDQALGRAPEALTPRRPPPPVFALRRFLEPLFSVDTILEATQTLCADAVKKLDLRGAGVRRARLHLFGVDGRDRTIEIGVSRPEREAKTLVRLFREKLSLAAETLDAEFGIEAARLDIVQLERIDGAARALVAADETQASAEQIAAIVDMLSARLGPKRVLRPKFNDTHEPERAGGWRSALNASPSMGEAAAKRPEGVRAPTMKKEPQEAQSETRANISPSVSLRAPASLKPTMSAPADFGGASATAPPSRGSGVPRRPLTLFSRPQPIEAIATVPDGPPIRFRWRRVLREVARAEGPERISGDWLKQTPARDYYRVEDKQGRRYWIYREGHYGEPAPPRWFVHGLFA